MAGFIAGAAGLELSSILGIVICSLLAVIGERKGLLTPSGALVSWFFGMAILGLCGLGWFLVLLSFFLLASIATSYKFQLKESLGAAEDRLGRRSWQNVVANGLTALLFVVSEFLQPGAVFLAGYLGAVSAALADTLSSEIGLTSSSPPRLITNLRPVKPGTHGGVSALGTFASLLGSVILALIAWALRLESAPNWTLATIILVCAVGGMAGSTVDSILGAKFEIKGKMSNGQVNLIATLAGGLSSAAVFALI